jgi:hypothetical protein
MLRRDKTSQGVLAGYTGDGLGETRNGRPGAAAFQAGSCASSQ